MRAQLGLITLVAIAAFSHDAMAAARVTGPIVELWVSDSTGSNVAWIRTDRPFSSECGTHSGYMVMPLSEPAMKEAYALALSAFLAGKNVTIGGFGSCHSNYEKIRFIYMSQ